MNLAPIVLFVYNRPSHTEQTLEALSKNKLAQQSVLYIYADGAKENANEETLQKITETRNVIRKNQSFKEIHFVESNKNIGLANSVIAGVTEVVNKHGRIIVLEDDIIVSPFFLDYMNDALEAYKNNPDVISIHAYNYPIYTKDLPETFFMKGADCWGWATWKKEWALLDTDAKKLLGEIERNGCEYEFDIEGSYPYLQMLRDQMNKKINSWAICWYASAFLKNKYTLYPSLSIIYNIGFDNSGTHHGESDHFNNSDWNGTKPVVIDAEQDIKTNQLVLSRWKEYHTKNKSVTEKKPTPKDHSLRKIGSKIYRKIIRNVFTEKNTSELLWSGNYTSWKTAQKKCSGYDADNILEKVKTAVIKVKNGEAAYERDTVVFDKLEYSQPLLDAFNLIIEQNSGTLNVVDFGGSLGSTYFQYKNLFEDVKKLSWKIVEQPHFVECGKQLMEDDKLKFHFSIDEAMSDGKANVLFLGSVLQYLQNPKELIQNFLAYGFEYIIIDRTGFVQNTKDRIVIQTVPEFIYKASYPVWFFNETKFFKGILEKYIIVQSFLSEVSPAIVLEDGTNAYWKGFFLKKNGK